MNFSQYFSERDNFGRNVGASNSMNVTDDVRAFLPSGNSILVSRNIGSTAISDFSSKASVSGDSNMVNKIETNHVRRVIYHDETLNQGSSRVAMEKIQNPNNLYATFSKRRTSLFNNTDELYTLTDNVRAFLPNGNATLVSRNIGSPAISDFSSKASGSSGSNMANKIETNHARRYSKALRRRLMMKCISACFQNEFLPVFSERDNFGSNVGASNSMNAIGDVRAFSPNGNSTLVSRNIGFTAISDFNSKPSRSGASNMANKIETNYARRVF
ncbi:hypothetical protein ACH5RR_040798 [Cinchona calisaya]|uniref:MADS-box domain-containing protein n=1 Tax=Cinchona calisaya TaxID=153742 RepID=A0ABD2XSE4_9GENT